MRQHPWFTFLKECCDAKNGDGENESNTITEAELDHQHREKKSRLQLHYLRGRDMLKQ